MDKHVMKLLKHPTGAYEMTCTQCSYHYVAKTILKFRTITLDIGDDTVEHVASTTEHSEDLLSLTPSAKKGEGDSLADQLFNIKRDE